MNRPLENAPENRRMLLTAVKNQQSIIEQQGLALEAMRRGYVTQNLVLDYICRVAGITPEVAEIRRLADIENPAQPVENPPEQPAVESTEQAATPEAMDSPLNPGITPGSTQHLPAAATGTPLDPGTTLPTNPFNNLTEVTAPVAGTESGEVPLPAVRTEVDVRVGDPMNLERGFPWIISPDAQGSSPETGEFAGGAKQASLTEEEKGSRTMAAFRLARLRIQAGVAEGDDLQVCASIEASKMSEPEINAEISTLAGVIKAAAKRTQRPAGTVPKSASVQRTTPSLVQAPGLSTEASLGDNDAEDLFL